MDYRRFGNLGFDVSRLSFGASSLGGVFRPVEESEAIRAVHAALAGGINYFDVAPAYGATRSETVLGKALKGVKRSSYHLSTKVGKYTSPGSYGNDTLDYSEKRIRASVDESSERLGVDYFDIVHIHDIGYQGRVKTEEALTIGYETVSTLKREGRIGGVSFGIYPMDLWHRIVSSLEIDAMLIHNHYCLCDTRARELLPAVAEKGIAMINASPFGMGLLNGRGPAAWHPANEAERSIFRKAAEFCEEQGVPIAKLALQFSASHPDMPTTLFGSASAESVQRNVRWIEEPYEGELIRAVQEILSPVMDRQWDFDAGVAELKKARR